MKKLLFSLLLLFSTNIFAQTVEAIEKELLVHLAAVNRLATKKTGNKLANADSLKFANQAFKQKLLSYTAKVPSTLAYQFPQLQKEHLSVATSDDGKFRIYTWDTYLGGSSHVYDHIYQYNTGKTINSKSFSYLMKTGEYTGRYLEIITADTNNTKVYLGYFYNVFPGKKAFQGVKAFKIEKTNLNDTCTVIKTATGYKNQIGFSYDYAHQHETRDHPHKLFHFFAKEHEFSFPVAMENGELTNRYHVYKFKGNHFEKIQKKGKGNVKQ